MKPISRMKQATKVIRDAFDLLTTQDRFKLLLLTFVNIAVSMADLLGLLLIGLIASQGIALISGKSTSSPLDFIFNQTLIKDLNQEMRIVVLGGIAAILLISKTIFSLFLTRRTIGFLAYREAVVSARFIDEFLHAPLEQQRKASAQATTGRAFAGANSAITQLLGNVVRFATEIIYLLFLFIGITILDWTITVPALLFYSTLGLFTTLYIGKTVKNLGSQVYSLGISGAELIQVAGQTKREISLSNRSEFVSDLFKFNRLENYQAVRNKSYSSVVPKYIAEIGLVIGALTMTGFQLMIKSAQETLSALAIFLVLSMRLIPSILRIQTALLEIIAAITPTVDFLHYFTEYEQPKLMTTNNIFPKKSKSQIILNNISVRYDKSDDYIFKNINLSIAKGEFIAITGPSGSGKTTLADVILGIKSVSAGEVLIDGISPLEKVRQFPTMIRYVPQDVQILPGTVHNNLVWPNIDQGFSKEHLWKCLQTAQLASFIRDLPEGLETVLNPNGTNLSGGQRQRLGIARALVSEPQILVLDEATSSLDVKTEEALTSEILNSLKGITRIVIAHRLSTIQNADRILYLESGRIQEISDSLTLSNLINPAR